MFKKTSSSVEWDAKDFVSYVVTGVDTKGKRFKLAYKTWFMASCINVWRGSKWGVTSEGKRFLLQRITN